MPALVAFLRQGGDFDFGPYFEPAPLEDAAVPPLAQVEELRHWTLPSIILEMPSRNFSGFTISRAATASTVASAFSKNDIAASFFSDPDLPPNICSMPLTKAGTNEIPRNN